MSAETKPIRIDIVSDVVCPWCIIGFKQLQAALNRARDTARVDLHWNPFELNPRMPPEGQNLREHLAGKYGTTLEESIAARARLKSMGAELGFGFNYADDMRTYNSFRAHQLLHWAGTLGRQHAVKMALFEAFFTHRRDINDIQVLADIAGSVGLDRHDAEAALRDERYAAEVRDQERFWMEQGIQGVPAIVFDRRLLVTGAQGVETYVDILKDLENDRAA